MKKYSFKVSEKNNMNSVIYAITSKMIGEKKEYFLEKLESKVLNIIKESDISIKEYYFDDEIAEIITIAIWGNKYIINGGVVKNNEMILSTKPKGSRFIPADIVRDSEYFSYIPSEKRKIFLIDLETANEIIPERIVKAGNEYMVCKIDPGKKYLAIEYRFGTHKIIATGICKFEKVNR